MVRCALSLDSEESSGVTRLVAFVRAEGRGANKSDIRGPGFASTARRHAAGLSGIQVRPGARDGCTIILSFGLSAPAN